RSEIEIGAVELEASRATAREPEIANDLVVDASENPRGARIGRAEHAAIIRTLEQALRREADAAQRLRRPAVAAPEPAIPPTERMEILARLGGPSANAAFGAPDFQHVRDRGAVGDAPVKAVAAEIGEAAATVDIILQGVQRVRRVIFGVRTRH